METKNIRQRALSWTEIVNAETTKINSMININLNDYIENSNNTNMKYEYSVPDPIKYLSFLSEWSGIKTRNTSNQPQSYEEFLLKSKNWLNGRRAPNYGNTLFPDMICSSEEYAKTLSLTIFDSIPINTLSSSPTSDSLCDISLPRISWKFLKQILLKNIHYVGTVDYSMEWIEYTFINQEQIA